MFIGMRIYSNASFDEKFTRRAILRIVALIRIKMSHLDFHSSDLM